MLATGSRSPFKAETIDVSSGGVGLLVDVQVRAGTPITVELRFDSPRLDLSLDGVVMHAAPMSGRWFAGVRFVGIGLGEELELSRFVLNEERALQAKQPYGSDDHERPREELREPAAGSSRLGSAFHTRRLARAS